MGLIVSIILGFGPMLLFAGFLYWLDRYEKEPKSLVLAGFLWGAIVAAGVSFLINTALGMGVYLVTQSQAATEIATGSLFAPPIEEILKGLAVLLVFLIFRSEFDSVLDGIVYAGIAALGFAATENSYYIYTYGYQEGGFEGLLWLTFVRVGLVGWQHPFYTAFIGIGLATARLNKATWVKILAPGAGLLAAIFAHAFHNTLASLLSGAGGGLVLGTAVDWFGWFLMFLVILWAISQVQKRLKHYLREEAATGVISIAQYKTACSAWLQSLARLSALFSGRRRNTAKFYQLCAELAHKKYQLANMGEVQHKTVIEKTRAELARLAPLARA